MAVPVVVAVSLCAGLAGCSSSKSTSAPKSTTATTVRKARVLAGCNTTLPTPPPVRAKYPSTPTTAPVTVTGKALVTYSSSDHDPAVGCLAPIIDGQDFKGAPVRIGGPTKLPTMVIAGAHWCPHCNEEIPQVAAWLAQGGQGDSIRPVLLSTGVAKGQPHYPPSLWVLSVSWTDAVMADSSTDQARVALGVAAYPTFILLDANGKVFQRFSGQVQLSDLVGRISALVNASSGSETATSVAG